MTPDDVRAAAEQLVDFHERFAPLFGKEQAQDHAYDYLKGLMVCPERKSIEPIALLVGHGDVSGLQKFVGAAPWAVRRREAEAQALFADELVPSAAGSPGRGRRGRRRVGLHQEGDRTPPGWPASSMSSTGCCSTAWDNGLRSVAVWKLEGNTNQEIAAKMGCIVPTVEQAAAVSRALVRGGGVMSVAERADGEPTSPALTELVDEACDRFEAAWRAAGGPGSRHTWGRWAGPPWGGGGPAHAEPLRKLLALELDFAAARRRPEPGGVPAAVPRGPRAGRRGLPRPGAAAPIRPTRPEIAGDDAQGPPCDADRNLLFGILALQNGLIDHEAARRRHHAWTRDKARPLADTSSPGATSTADQRPARGPGRPST